MKTFAFIYLMKDEPEAIRQKVSEHVDYWKSKQLPGYEGGPFEDKSGGLIVFNAENKTQALELVSHDPFFAGHLLHTRYIKEWIKE